MKADDTPDTKLAAGGVEADVTPEVRFAAEGVVEADDTPVRFTALSSSVSSMGSITRSGCGGGVETGGEEVLVGGGKGTTKEVAG